MIGLSREKRRNQSGKKMRKITKKREKEYDDCHYVSEKPIES